MGGEAFNYPKVQVTATTAENAAMELNGEPNDVALLTDAMEVIGHLMGGSDGWTYEFEVFTYDKIRSRLGLPERCLRCEEEGHTTYSHYGRKQTASPFHSVPVESPHADEPIRYPGEEG